MAEEETLEKFMARLNAGMVSYEMLAEWYYDESRANKLLLDALRAVEWIYSPREGQGECWWCRELERDGHAPDCQRQAAISAARGKDD
jgi:hypothetical protein